MPRTHLAIAMVAAALSLFASGGQALAQMPPYTAYGMGLRAGDVVTASIDGVECDHATVSAAGNWKISIPAEAPCHPSEGATVHFAVNGKEHPTTVRWSGGGAPLNPRIGVALGTNATPTATAATPAPRATATATRKATATPKASTTPKAAPTRTPTPKAKATTRIPFR